MGPAPPDYSVISPPSDSLGIGQPHDFASRTPFDFTFLHDKVSIAKRRDLREVRDTQNLMVLSDLRDLLSDRFSNSATHA